jgi:hypothetical protein
LAGGRNRPSGDPVAWRRTNHTVIFCFLMMEREVAVQSQINP